MQDAPHHDLGDMTKLAEALKVGATGEFPHGKLNESDEGEIRLAIGSFKGNVILVFGKPITWIGLPPHEARALAEKLREKAWQAMRKQDDQDQRIA